MVAQSELQVRIPTVAEIVLACLGSPELAEGRFGRVVMGLDASTLAEDQEDVGHRLVVDVDGAPRRVTANIHMGQVEMTWLRIPDRAGWSRNPDDHIYWQCTLLTNYTDDSCTHEEYMRSLHIFEEFLVRWDEEGKLTCARPPEVVANFGRSYARRFFLGPLN